MPDLPALTARAGAVPDSDADAGQRRGAGQERSPVHPGALFALRLAAHRAEAGERDAAAAAFGDAARPAVRVFQEDPTLASP